MAASKVRLGLARPRREIVRGPSDSLGPPVDEDYLYLVLEFTQGGELFSYLKSVDTVGETGARFYAAQVVHVFAYLHERDIIYRDLKPENLLLDTRGYLKLIDFSFAKRVPKGTKTYTLCGTPE